MTLEVACQMAVVEALTLDFGQDNTIPMLSYNPEKFVRLLIKVLSENESCSGFSSQFKYAQLKALELMNV